MEGRIIVFSFSSLKTLYAKCTNYWQKSMLLLLNADLEGSVEKKVCFSFSSFYPQRNTSHQNCWESKKTHTHKNNQTKVPRTQHAVSHFFCQFYFCLFRLWTWFSPNVCLYKTHKSPLVTAVNFFSASPFPEFLVLSLFYLWLMATPSFILSCTCMYSPKEAVF